MKIPHQISFCNFNCKYCFARFENSNRILSLNQCLEIIDQISKTEIRKINFERMYLNFEIVARTEYFKEKQTLLLKEKETGNYYLYNSEKPLSNIKKKIQIEKFCPKVNERGLK